ncbi:zinc transporter ZntB [Kushneria indalinina]|uniref:Zinc transporter n=1 Tax=Kushneria indalinina DSM 14324 TaxID=1122140 RepID=A0A3D9DUB5_9GAMM|nr:zinc transporter ZntB [Kushneria indalinina]REC94271.1 zinc transporter [Kushneria indalinina DSM 14324]
MSSASLSSFVVAYRLDGQGSGMPLDPEELARVWHHDEAQLWMHLDFTHKDVDHFLATIAELSEDVIEALTEEDTRPRVAVFKGGRITTLRGINLNPGADPDDLISLRVWLADNRLITVRRRPLQSITRVRAYLEAGEGARNVGELLAGMADTLVDRVGDLTHQLDESLGELEERQTLKNAAAITSEDLTEIRQPLITLRRFMEPQYHCLARLAEDDIFDETARLWLREASNQLYRYVEDFRAMQERALILQEQIWNSHNERLNERMYLMAIMTAVFLPLTFLTGLLGINVGGIPGAESPAGFAVVVLLSMLVGAGVMALLKKWRWW